MTAREIVAPDFASALEDLSREGFRLDLVYPADDPARALLSRDGECVSLARPNAPELPVGMPPFAPEFVLTRAAAAGSGQGRAGMMYRDLIPSRLGGRYIASHITIPEGGPVADWVHFHRVALQLIFVRRGWVRVVYEDQGDPFVMEAGDLVLQPPLIRHRVLESSSGLEVVEISAPALHATYADHELELPNAAPIGRDYGGQQFLHHVAARAPFAPFNDCMVRDTGLAKATGGHASARILRPEDGKRIEFAPHDGELVFGFVVEGVASLDHAGVQKIGPADAVVIPPGEAWSLADPSADFALLHVTTGRLDGAAHCLL